jgi:3D (Asp-Asp-Asp) domain-containing protein
MFQPIKITFLTPIIILLTLSACSNPETKSLEVTATAYNSVKAQTANDPSIAAWGDTLKPGMKSIAISRDLLDSGFYHNMEVTIDGLEGTYKVLDKMNRRWTRKIDIYMGTDVAKAREWGKQEVTIRWTLAEQSK